ncbi:MAG TPA: hypothetical protein PKN93_16985, partial [Leptospiraceae bacterium]|nr:hypothetical protein [Leptospiraceae bacterium]
ASVQKDGVTQDELDRVKASMVADFLYGLRSNAEYADNLSYYELLYGNYETLFTKITALSAIAPADVKKAAIEYMTPDKMHSARLKQAKGEEQ